MRKFALQYEGTVYVSHEEWGWGIFILIRIRKGERWTAQNGN
jgi:hypothetical protein